LVSSIVSCPFVPFHLAIVSEAEYRRTDNTMAKRRTENTMAKRRRTDNAMAKRRTDSV
jgi:hypothetical protein